MNEPETREISQKRERRSKTEGPKKMKIPVNTDRSLMSSTHLLVLHVCISNSECKHWGSGTYMMYYIPGRSQNTSVTFLKLKSAIVQLFPVSIRR